MRKQRRRVDRAERVKPTPEAAQHTRPWPLMLLLHLGPDADGIDSDEFEALIEIVQTFKALTAELQLHGTAMSHEQRYNGASPELSDRLALMTNVWFAFCNDVGPVALHLVEQIEDSVPIRSTELLRLAARRWSKLKHDMRPRLDNDVSSLTGSGRTSVSEGDRGHAFAISHAQTPVPQVAHRAGAAAQTIARSAPTKR